MALLQEIEDNFSNLNQYHLTNCQENFIVKFSHIDNMFELNINKDLEYMYLKSNSVNTDIINLKLIGKKNTNLVLNYIKNNTSTKKRKSDYIDNFGLFRAREVFNKGNCNFENILQDLLQSSITSSLSINSIPKNLLYSRKQIAEMLVNELKYVNSCKDYSDYIIPSDEPYSFIMNIFIEGSDKKNIKLLIKFDPDLYPFYPPTLKYISPNAKRSLVYNFSNLDILKLENWNPIINMDWLIRNLNRVLNDLYKDYIESSELVELTELDKEIINFSSIIGEKIYQDIKIDLHHTKFSLKETKENSNGKDRYWKSGVGYGFQGRDEWDIKKFVKDQEVKNKNLEKSLSNIILLISNEFKISTLIDSPVLKYIANNINNSTLLEINKMPQLFIKILELFDILIDILDESFNKYKLQVYNSLENLRQDIKPLIESQIIDNEDKLNTYITIISIVDCVKDKTSNIQSNIKDIVFEANVSDKDKYSEMISNEQMKLFSDFAIESTHRFSSHKNEVVAPKSLMRMSSEFSSIRKNLPNNWDTSIVVRASQENLNIFSFVITGPKDTPYHNGIYEFHAYFPKNYPEKEPKVLLDTTGNSSVRFNPNLYNCGKVCLSLLGTWSGQDGESWNKHTSTFLQVLVSIQSLILVEQPYFNEPGWERQMHTEEGKKRSFDYNDKIRLENLRWAIVDKFENPPKGFENLTTNHFLMKKQEIFSTVDSWISESKNYKSKMTTLREKLVKLYSEHESQSMDISDEEILISSGNSKEVENEKFTDV